jgi:hypothetical protein
MLTRTIIMGLTALFGILIALIVVQQGGDWGSSVAMLRQYSDVEMIIGVSTVYVICLTTVRALSSS